jgi:hypothetical protein
MGLFSSGAIEDLQSAVSSLSHAQLLLYIECKVANPDETEKEVKVWLMLNLAKLQTVKNRTGFESRSPLRSDLNNPLTANL